MFNEHIINKLQFIIKTILIHFFKGNNFKRISIEYIAKKEFPKIPTVLVEVCIMNIKNCFEKTQLDDTSLYAWLPSTKIHKFYDIPLS